MTGRNHTPAGRDAEMADRLRLAYRTVAEATTATAPPGLPRLLEPARLTRRAPRARTVRVAMAGFLVAAAVGVGVVAVSGRRAESNTVAAPAYAALRHAALGFLPSGYGYVGARGGTGGDPETVAYANDTSDPWTSPTAIRLITVRLGEQVPPPLAGTSTTRVVRAGVMLTDIVAPDGRREYRWSDLPGLEIIASGPAEAMARGPIDVAATTLLFTDSQWAALTARSGFDEYREEVPMRRASRHRGPRAASLTLEGSLQRGVAWSFGGSGTSAFAGSRRDPLFPGVGPAWMPTSDPESALLIDGEVRSSTFLHPGLPGFFAVVSADAPEGARVRSGVVPS